jgi:hypothetical protein
MDDAADARLRAFVRSIVIAGGVPRSQRDDVQDEMLGHLLERVAAERRDGASDDEAVTRAIADFGHAATLAPDFARAYHSRLWATTVGVLLAERASLGVRPTRVTALAWLVVLAGAIAAIAGVVTVWTATPLRAVVAGGSELLFTVLAALVVQALIRGRVWAFWCSVVIALELFVSGIVNSAGAPSGTTSVPLGTISAGIVLLSLLGSEQTVRSFFAGSPPIGERLVAVIGGLFALSLVAPMAAWLIPDPTQATAADVDMVVMMECGHAPFHVQDGPLLQNQQYANVRVDIGWRKTDLLPFGFRGPTGGDTAGFRTIGPDGTSTEEEPVPSWQLLVDAPTVNDAETGEIAGWWGSTSPSVALIPDTIGSFTVGIDNERIRAGRTIRVSWTIAPASAGDAPWPTVEVAYAHLDRFLLVGTVDCGHRTVATPRSIPPPSPATGPLSISGA